MRKQFLITCAAVLAFCLLLLLFKAKQHTTSIPGQGATVTNTSTQPEPPKTAKNVAAVTNALKATAASTAAPVSAAGISNVIKSRMLALWQSPIDFYGKVIDQNSNPVDGATISFHWVETPTEDGNRSANTTSDAQGLFSLHNALGLSLAISVSKNGFYTSRRDNDTFTYGSLGGAKFSPDPFNPVIFHLLKKGTPQPLIGLKKNYRIARDGTPLSINLTTGATEPTMTGDFVVQCWIMDAGKQPGQEYDWHCTLTVPGGGMVLTDEEFPFLAPESGYAPSIEISMPQDSLHWQSEATLRFYYLLANGCYGRMTFSMIAGGHHFCMIDSAFNPTGSRDLEPGNQR